MNVDDFIVLGRAVPILLKDRRKTICAAGYSEKLGLARIYPTYWTDGIHRWDILSTKLVGDRRDSREESWKREKDSKFEVVGSISDQRREKEELIESLYEDICTVDLNKERRSLAVIKPNIVETHFVETNKSADKGELAQRVLNFFQQSRSRRPALKVKTDFSQLPYIRYVCGSSCKTQKPHDQQVLEWGVFKGMEKNPVRIEQIWDNLHITDKNWYKYLLLGNLRDKRTTWLIISILRGKKNRDLKTPIKKKEVFKKGIKNKGQKKLNLYD